MEEIFQIYSSLTFVKEGETSYFKVSESDIDRQETNRKTHQLHPKLISFITLKCVRVTK